MRSEDKYFKTMTQDELWQRYCGFLDLSVDEFMAIQNELLMDEIERIAESTLGKKIMRNQKPKSVEEFRRMVPLTTYDDYEPYLSEQQEDALAIEPQMWCHTAGRRGRFKWIPLGSEFLEKLVKNCVCCLILASAKQKGEVNVRPGFRFLLLVAPPPYISGSIFQFLANHLSFQRIPSLETTKGKEFQSVVQEGFKVALKEGIDFMMAIASVLAKVSEQFSGEARGTKLSMSMVHPKILFRLLRAGLRSKIEKRNILPRDLWPAKAIMTGGLDTRIYKGDITYYWGNEPYDIYVCTESVIVATQTWGRKGMVFLPDLIFLEFIPYEGKGRQQNGEACELNTVLLNELEEGKEYEVVITHLYGLPLLRYRMGDIVKVIALRDAETGVNLPHIVFQRRVGETIDLTGLARLDETTIWQAIANTGIKYVDWVACKEYDPTQSFVHLYVELKEEREADTIAAMVDEQLKIIDIDYRDIDAYLKLQPVRVTLLCPGTFQHFTEEKVKEGASLAHLKPIHMNPPEAVIQRLLQLSDIGVTKS